MSFDSTPKPDVFSLDGLIAWLETQPGETEYSFVDGDDCLLTRYLRDSRVAVAYVYPGGWRDTDGAVHVFPDSSAWDSSQNVLNLAAGYGPRTYAAALSRARALQGA